MVAALSSNGHMGDMAAGSCIQFMWTDGGAWETVSCTQFMGTDGEWAGGSCP